MARIRTIKPDFCTSPSAGRISREARLMFLLLLTDADDEGRLAGSLKRLAGLLYPDDDDVTPTKIRKWLAELQREQMVMLYRDGEADYIWIVNFLKHQKISHPTPSRLPKPPEDFPNDSGTPPELSGDVPETFRPDLGSGSRKGKGEPSVADGLLTEWFESRTPRPLVKAGQWVGMRSVVAKALNNGHPPDRVRLALRSCDVVSTGWLEPALRKVQTANGTSYKPEPTHFR